MSFFNPLVFFALCCVALRRSFSYALSVRAFIRSLRALPKTKNPALTLSFLVVAVAVASASGSGNNQPPPPPFRRHSRTIYFVHAQRVATKKSPGAIFRERKRNPQGAYQGRYAQIIAFGNLFQYGARCQRSPNRLPVTTLRVDVQCRSRMTAKGKRFPAVMASAQSRCINMTHLARALT